MTGNAQYNNSANGEEEDCIMNTGGKARRKETTRKMT
jgi:hypothetical protein